MKRLVFLSMLLALTLCATSVFADGKLSGYMFGDYYNFTAGHDKDLEGKNGFWLRRIYFTYNYKWDDSNFSSKFRLEMAHPGSWQAATEEGEEGSFASGKAEPVVKDAYLKWKPNDHAVILGISSTPTWDVVEHLWGYRSVEKTPLDLYKFGSSRDFGVALKGKMGDFQYHAMFGNGNSNKSENNDGKKFLLSLGYHITKELFVEVYGDFDSRDEGKDRNTLQGFISYKAEKFRVGLLYAQQTRKAGDAGGEDQDFSIASLYGVVKVAPKFAVFARADQMMDPNPSADSISYLPIDSSAEFTFFTVGLDFTPIKNVHIMPNIESVTYKENDAGETPDSDMVARLTFYWKFK